METTDHAHNGILAIIIVCIAVFAIVGWACSAVLFLQPKSLPKCNDFGSYADIVQSYKDGNKALDGYPKDGIPCNNRRPSWWPK